MGAWGYFLGSADSEQEWQHVSPSTSLISTISRENVRQTNWSYAEKDQDDCVAKKCRENFKWEWNRLSWEREGWDVCVVRRTKRCEGSKFWRRRRGMGGDCMLTVGMHRWVGWDLDRESWGGAVPCRPQRWLHQVWVGIHLHVSERSIWDYGEIYHRCNCGTNSKIESITKEKSAKHVSGKNWKILGDMLYRLKGAVMRIITRMV